MVTWKEECVWYTICTVQLLGAVNTWAWGLYTAVPKYIVKDMFFPIDHKKLSTKNQFEVEPWYPLIWISFRFVFE